MQSSKVLNQVQIDLVDLSASPSTADTSGVTYKYILVVLDVFSRFCFLRPLRSKSSAEVAQRLIEIFSDTGPPVRIQSDQGTEFKGSVKMLMQAMGAQIIYSRPYHPQAQGKVCGCKCGLISFTHLNNFYQIERSHRTWKSYLFYDVVGDYDTFMKSCEFGWAANLPIYQHIYNTTSHKSIGM